MTATTVVATTHGAMPAFAADCESIRNDLQQLKGLIQRKQFIEKALQKCSDDSGINYFHAYNLERRGKIQKALHFYQISITLDEKNSRPFLGMGDIYSSLGQTEKGIEAYERGLLIDPANKQLVKRLKTSFDKKDINNNRKTASREQVTQQPVPPVAIKTDTIEQDKDDEPELITESTATVQPIDNDENIVVHDAPEVVAQDETALKDAATDPKQIVQDETLPITHDITAPAPLKEISGNLPTVSDSAPVSLKESKESPSPAGNVAKKQTPLEGYAAKSKDVAELITTATEDLTIISGFTTDILALIQFKTGKHKLNKETRNFIKRGVCGAMNDEEKSVHFEVVGHTDDLGTLAVNQRLSLKRANAISTLLSEECDIASSRLHVTAYGKSQPMAPNITPDNREENRRVEIKRIQKI